MIIDKGSYLVKQYKVLRIVFGEQVHADKCWKPTFESFTAPDLDNSFDEQSGHSGEVGVEID